MTGDGVTPHPAARAFDGFFADPHLVRLDDRWWVYPTTDGVVDWAATTFRAFSSPDLESWTDEGEVFSLRRDAPWASGFAWAPAAVEHDGRYYFYFTADDNIGVAVGDHPAGPFTDLGRPLVPRGAFPGRAIDPSLFRDDDGAWYLLWGNAAANIVPLGPDLMSFDADAVRTFVPGEFREAAWLHRRGATYYLSWSENDTRDPDYRVCYATGPSPFGPWAERGVLLEPDDGVGAIGTGHHSIGCDGDEWTIAYHRFAIPGGDGFHREVVLGPLRHTSDGLLERVRTHDSRLPQGAAAPSRAAAHTQER